jgi:hypothetical protein
MMRRFLVAWFTVAHVALAQTPSPDSQIWMDFVPLWHAGTRITDELELSLRTAWRGTAPTQYWATNTLEWNGTPWLGLNAIGAVVESRGPEHGSGYFEARVAAGMRLIWRGQRVRASEYVRVEHRFVRPLGTAPFSIERLRHREQVLAALNHASLTEPQTAFLIADVEWFFVHDGRGGWASNQLRARAGLGYRWSARRTLECILNDTQRRDGLSAEFEDSDHVLRLRWREAF